MTALKKYARIEGAGLWRASPDAQRRDVIVSMGDATLTVTDLKDQPLAHWSLAAVARANPGLFPAIYHPDGDPGETLELAETETQMIEAIETLRQAINRARPKPGRLRWLGVTLSVVAIVALALFWLPKAMQDHTLRVVPPAKRASIGAALLERIERVSGPACKDTAGRAALGRLGTRLNAGKLVVLQDMTRTGLHLPGGLIVLDHSVIEDYEEPDVAAGYVLTELAHRTARDPLRDMLSVVDLRENFRLLTTGNVAPAALDAYARHLMVQTPPPPDLALHLSRFERAQVRSTPYAYAVDITGETTLPLIEGDPMYGKLTEPLLSDATWLRLQNICNS